MKIVFLDFSTLGALDISRFGDFGIVEVYDTTSPEETAYRVVDADIVVTNKVVLDETILAQASKLKLICVAATGVNNIDLDAAKKTGVAVANVAGYSTESVVAQTFAIYFHLAHRNAYYDHYGKNEWVHSEIFTHHLREFHNLNGKRWGIVGLGTIGERVATVATAFGAEVVYYSTSGRNHNAAYAELSLEGLLKTCDVVSIHAPLNERTDNLIAAKELAMMKRNALLLNLGRGGIVNEDDLADALETGKISGAGLDVLACEPPKADNKLFKIKKSYNLFLSPHIAWASVEAREKLVEEIYDNIEAFNNNQSRNRVV
jgi:glycerate dehydrogenase